MIEKVEICFKNIKINIFDNFWQLWGISSLNGGKKAQNIPKTAKNRYFLRIQAKIAIFGCFWALFTPFTPLWYIYRSKQMFFDNFG